MKVFSEFAYKLFSDCGIICYEDEYEGTAVLAHRGRKMWVYRDGKRSWEVYYKNRRHKFDCPSSLLKFVISRMTKSVFM